MKHPKQYRILKALLLTSVGIVFFGCAAEVQRPLSQLDTPEYQVATGMQFIKAGEVFGRLERVRHGYATRSEILQRICGYGHCQGLSAGF